MTRAELVDATYDSAERLNQAKLKHGRISRRRAHVVADRIQAARDLRARLVDREGEGNQANVIDTLEGEIAKFSESTVCDKRELFWARHLLNFKVSQILRTMRRYYFGGADAGNR